MLFEINGYDFSAYILGNLVNNCVAQNKCDFRDIFFAVLNNPKDCITKLL